MRTFKERIQTLSLSAETAELVKVVHKIIQGSFYVTECKADLRGAATEPSSQPWQMSSFVVC